MGSQGGIQQLLHVNRGEASQFPSTGRKREKMTRRRVPPRQQERPTKNQRDMGDDHAREPPTNDGICKGNGDGDQSGQKTCRPRRFQPWEREESFEEVNGDQRWRGTPLVYNRVLRTSP